jgi:hypothetical protein
MEGKMMLMRKYNPSVLEILERYNGQKFKIGTCDCNLLLAEVLDLICETDYYGTLRGNYKSIKAGHALLKEKFNLDSLLDVLNLHAQSIDFNELYNGDIVITNLKYSAYHCSVVFNQMYLAVDPVDSIFKFKPISDLQCTDSKEEIKAYRIQK